MALDDDDRLSWFELLLLYGVIGCAYVVDALAWCWRRVRGLGLSGESDPRDRRRGVE